MHNGICIKLHAFEFKVLISEVSLHPSCCSVGLVHFVRHFDHYTISSVANCLTPLYTKNVIQSKVFSVEEMKIEKKDVSFISQKK